MPPSNSSEEIRRISELVASQHPATVRDLAEALRDYGAFDSASFLDAITQMTEEGAIRLSSPNFTDVSILDYLTLTSASSWFWTILILSPITVLVVLTITESFPYSILRWIAGSVLLFLPGYTTIKSLFPRTELHFYQRTALSFAVAIAVVPTLGFLLNFTPWEIRLVPITLSLGLYSILAGIIAFWRSYRSAVRY